MKKFLEIKMKTKYYEIYSTKDDGTNVLELVVKPSIIEDEIYKKAQALEIIKKYGHFDFYTGEYVVNVPTNKEKEYDLLKEVLL